MGSYLSEPVCEKISNDESNDKLYYGASSMQGWRLTQEDAHNSILDFDTNTSLFAVYDGHGGHEVAEYCANNLPNFLKALEIYKSGDIEKALVDAFLGFDATITSVEVISELRRIANTKTNNEDESDDEDEENVSQLNQEAAMPLEEVMEKYTAAGPGKLTVAALKESAGKQPVSPFLKARKSKNIAGSSGSTSSIAGSSKKPSQSDDTASNTSSSKNDNISSKKGKSELEDAKSDSIPKEEATTIDFKNESETNSFKNPKIIVTEPITLKQVNETVETKKTEESVKDGIAEEHQNGEVKTPENNCVANEEIDESIIQENGDISKKGKGKALCKTKVVLPPLERTLRPKRTSQQMYHKILEFEDESAESDDDEDKSFTVMDNNSDDSEQDGLNTTTDVEHSSDEDEFDQDEADDEEDLDYEELEYDDEDEEEGECETFMNNMKSGPGSDSGCTAVLALLVGNELYVANAGDSRCIVCREGKAVEMSFDHKPEDARERARVVKAGGRVTHDGRINNGLNLSRAIGDHAYKLHSYLTDREQMITALPDVKRLTVDPTRDKFMVLACDGIWNYMSSEEVVEFVGNRLRSEDRPTKLSTICEEMFDHCLAPDTIGDGTGCDNMTCIIVEFRQTLVSPVATAPGIPVGALKRASSPNTEEPSKRPKTDLPLTDSSSNEMSAEISTAKVKL